MKKERFLKAIASNKIRTASRILEEIRDDIPRKDLLYFEGVLLEKKGKFQEALKRFDMALVLHLSDDILWLAKARTLMELGRLEISKRAAERALKLRSGSSEAHLLLAEILFRSKDYHGALEHVDAAIKGGAGSADALTLKGILISIVDQDFMKALKYFDSAIEVDEDHARAWSNRGMALKEIGDRDGAIFSFQKAIMLNGGDETARKMLRRMGQEEFLDSLEE